MQPEYPEWPMQKQMRQKWKRIQSLWEKKKENKQIKDVGVLIIECKEQRKDYYGNDLKKLFEEAFSQGKNCKVYRVINNEDRPDSSGYKQDITNSINEFISQEYDLHIIYFVAEPLEYKKDSQTIFLIEPENPQNPCRQLMDFREIIDLLEQHEDQQLKHFALFFRANFMETAIKTLEKQYSYLSNINLVTAPLDEDEKCVDLFVLDAIDLEIASKKHIIDLSKPGNIENLKKKARDRANQNYKPLALINHGEVIKLFPGFLINKHRDAEEVKLNLHMLSMLAQFRSNRGDIPESFQKYNRGLNQDVRKKQSSNTSNFTNQSQSTADGKVVHMLFAKNKEKYLQKPEKGILFYKDKTRIFIYTGFMSLKNKEGSQYYWVTLSGFGKINYMLNNNGKFTETMHSGFFEDNNYVKKQNWRVEMIKNKQTSDEMKKISLTNLNDYPNQKQYCRINYFLNKKQNGDQLQKLQIQLKPENCQDNANQKFLLQIFPDMKHFVVEIDPRLQRKYRDKGFIQRIAKKHLKEKVETFLWRCVIAHKQMKSTLRIYESKNGDISQENLIYQLNNENHAPLIRVFDKMGEFFGQGGIFEGQYEIFSLWKTQMGYREEQCVYHTSSRFPQKYKVPMRPKEPNNGQNRRTNPNPRPQRRNQRLYQGPQSKKKHKKQ